MTASSTPLRTLVARVAVPLTIVLALAGCAGGSGEAAASKTPTPSASTAGPCTDVTVIVDYGSLDSPSLKECGAAGVASATLKDAGIVTEGTADYGDQVICRVNDEPAPADESCATLPADFYWALWVKTAADADWEYAQEGAATLQLDAGQSLALVYTDAADANPAPPES